MTDSYYHQRDLQTIQTREIIAAIFNSQRAKGPPAKGSDYMMTFEEKEAEDIKKQNAEVPDEDLVEKIRKKYGGK